MVKTYSLAKDGDTKLSPHFRVREFRPRWNGKNDGDVIKIDEELIMRLEALSDCVNNSPIYINDGYRTEAFDIYLTGKAGQHTTGRAADIRVNGVTAETLAVLAEACGFKGIGVINSNSIHVDTREGDRVVCFKENGTKKGTETVVSSFLKNCSWLHTVVIPQNKISSIEYYESREPVKTTAKKFSDVDYIINGGFFYPYTHSIFGYVANGIVRNAHPDHVYGMHIINHDELYYGIKTNDTENFISGYPALITNGEYSNEYTKTPEIDGYKARTAIGYSYNNGEVIICVADAKSGLTLRGLRQVMFHLGCYSAINLDGGGSSSLYSKGKCLNKQGDQRCVNNVIMIRCKG